EVIKGKRAYGCSNWKEGCGFVLEPDCKGLTLTGQQIQILLQQHVLPSPVQINNEPRMLILSTRGVVMDLRLPSADRQQKEGKADHPSKKAPAKKSRKPLPPNN
nr:hypothetical protein [Desulfobulbaceae bacterium]